MAGNNPTTHTHDIFISHASEDKAWCEKFIRKIKSFNPELRIWFDEAQMQAALGSVHDILGQNLGKSRHFVPIMTPIYFQKKWAKAELNIAIDKDPDGSKRFIIPILLKNCEIPDFLKHLKHFDFRPEDEFNERCRFFVNALKDDSLANISSLQNPKQQYKQDKWKNKRLRQSFILTFILVVAFISAWFLKLSEYHKPAMVPEEAVAILDTTSKVTSSPHDIAQPTPNPEPISGRKVHPDQGDGTTTSSTSNGKTDLVPVNIKIDEIGSNMDDIRRYGNLARHIMRYLNRCTAEEVLQGRKELADFVTPAGWNIIKKLIAKGYRLRVSTEAEIKAIISYYGEDYVEVRPITVSLEDIDTGNTFEMFLVLGFTKEEPYRLDYVAYDEIKHLEQLARNQKPLAVNTKVYTRLFDFFKELEEAYNHKDLTAIRQAYVDTAEIIVGRNVNGKTDFYTRNKEGYVSNLQRFFEMNNKFTIRFYEFTFKRSPLDSVRFIAEFRQQWDAVTYQDSGWIFVEVEADEQTLLINRLWQPQKKQSEENRAYPGPAQARR